jgi:hypothetical protein
VVMFDAVNAADAPAGARTSRAAMPVSNRARSQNRMGALPYVVC